MICKFPLNYHKFQSTEEKERPVLLRQQSSVKDGEELPQFEAQKVEEEERQSGNLKWEVITAYFRAGGSIFFIAFTVALVLLATTSAAAADYWVSYW